MGKKNKNKPGDSGQTQQGGGQQPQGQQPQQAGPSRQQPQQQQQQQQQGGKKKGGQARESVLYCNLNGLTDIARDLFNFNENETKRHLRITTSVLKKILQIVPDKRSGWDKHVEVIVFAFWLASGTSYRITGTAFNVSRFTVRTIVHRKLQEFEVLFSSYIKYPGREEYKRIGNGFNRRAGCKIFHKALGAIDGTHIRIKCPTHLREQYLNRKMYYSIQMQAVCDHLGKFISILIGYPGSVHDQTVLQNSPLYRKGVFPPRSYYLLGDNSYSCQLNPIAIITPFKEHEEMTDGERMFNNYHSKARNIVECSFGLLKSRWRSIFNKDLELNIQHCIQTIAACCIIHNICLSEEMLDEQSIEFMDDDSNNLSEEIDDLEEDSNDAVIFRNVLMESL